MSHLIWSQDELVHFTQSDDAEVRFWAVDRLVRHFPEDCCDAIAKLLLDDHAVTPTVVARHLGEHGAAKHHAILVRGFRLLRGLTPGFCLQALARLGYPGVPNLVTDALKRGDLTDPALAIIVEALADLATAQSRDLVRDLLSRHGDLLTEPAALRGALRVVETEQVPGLLAQFMHALNRRGIRRAGETFRTLMDGLKIDDATWCFRTGPSGHLELRKTIKAVESGYDCDILAAMGESTIKQLARQFRAGSPTEVIRALAEWTRETTGRLSGEAETDRLQRVSAAVGALSATSLLDDAAQLGRQFQQWLLGFHLSAAFATARGLDIERALKRARGDLGELLALAEIETAHLLEEVPSAIALVCRDEPQRAHQAQEWCLRMLEAQGPFFPKVIALETLGELRSVHFIPEIMEYLSDENSYIYSAAERALSKMGEAIVKPAVSRMETGADPDAAHSILVLLCDLGTPSAFEAVMQHFDWFMDSVGPGTTTEWVSLFGMEELIEPLRDWLEEDPALVGQGLLLLGAIHNVPIPEETEILRAIEDERSREAEAPESDAAIGGSEPEGGGYVM